LTVATRVTVIVPDLQIPYHDKRAVDNLVRFVGDFKPDQLVNVGDDIDAPETSTWTKGKAGEYAGTLQAAFDSTRLVHARFREALGGKPYHVSRSNHGDRTQKYIDRYAPALRSLSCLRLEDLIGYRDLGIDYHREPFRISDDWVACHGDEGTLSLIGGRTAGLLAEKWGVSVVCGHTHRAGIVAKSYGYGGRVTRTVTGMETGHLMDVGAARYLDGGHCDWQEAFSVLYECRGRSTPVLVPVHNDGSFVVEGVVYG
jgi:hypothetical protein